MQAKQETEMLGASAMCPEKADICSVLTKMLDVGKYFRAYCYRSVVELGFSLNEIDVLLSLWNHPEQNTVKGISENAHLSKGMISQAVESLQKKQYVTVDHDQRDRRSLLVKLTEMAQPTLDRIQEAAVHFAERIMSGVPQEELLQVDKIVTRVHKNKENMKAKNKTGGAREAAIEKI